MKYLTITILSILTFITCKKEAKIEEIDKTYLQGTWKTYLDYDNGLFAATYITVSFTSDSFNLKKYDYSDAISIDTCQQKNNTNFSAGNFSLQAKKIIFKGKFTSSNYSTLNTDTCSSIGNYNKEGLIYKKADTLFLDLHNTPNYYGNFVKLLKQ